MSNYSSLKSAIDANIKANGRREITGPVLNAILNAVVNSLGDGYLFRGVAIPSTNPGTPDQNVAYLAITEGTYTHMGGLSVTDGELSVFSYNGAWSKIPLALVPTKTSQLDNDLRFVSSEEMGESLSLKQDTIQDLSEIRSGAALANNSDHRPYNSSNPDGMGYLVLKKNKTFAEQVTEENTIYEIRYDFDLDGESISLPTGTTLQFVGGQISNGTLSGDGIRVIAGQGVIFGSSLTLNLTNTIGEISARWFGNNSSSINKTINAFPASVIRIDGNWTFDETIVVPFDTTLVCNYGTITLSGSTPGFTFYLGRNEQKLSGMQITLNSSFSGEAIHIYGVDSSHSAIRGYQSTIERNFDGNDISLPSVFSNRTAGHIAILIDKTDLFYMKTFHSYAYNVETHLRIEGSGSGLNSTTWFLSSWFCSTCISKNGSTGRTTKFHVVYQCYFGSSKVVSIDNFNPATTIDNAEYHLTIWDTSTAPNLKIDNGINSLFYQEDNENGNYAIRQFFSNKGRIRWSYVNANKTNKSQLGDLLPIVEKSVYRVNSYILVGATTRLDAIKKMIDYIKSLNTPADFEVDLMLGFWYYIDSSVQNKLSLLLYDSSEANPIPLSDAVRLRMVFCIGSGAGDQYVRFETEVLNYTKNVRLFKMTSITYTDHEVTAITDNKVIRTPVDSRSMKTTELPTILGTEGKGYSVFDETRGKIVVWNGTAWVNADGTAL